VQHHERPLLFALKFVLDGGAAQLLRMEPADDAAHAAPQRF